VLSVKPWGLGNLLMMFDESIQKIIKHLEDGHPDRALFRAKLIHDAVQKIMNRCVPEVHTDIEKKL
jgi:hypothetical protein